MRLQKLAPCFTSSPKWEQPLDPRCIYFSTMPGTWDPLSLQRNPSSLSARTLGSGCINASDGPTLGSVFILSCYPLKDDFHEPFWQPWRSQILWRSFPLSLLAGKSIETPYWSIWIFFPRGSFYVGRILCEIVDGKQVYEKEEGKGGWSSFQSLLNRSNVVPWIMWKIYDFLEPLSWILITLKYFLRF